MKTLEQKQIEREEVFVRVFGAAAIFLAFAIMAVSMHGVHQ